KYECGDCHGNLPVPNRLNGSHPPDTPSRYTMPRRRDTRKRGPTFTSYAARGLQFLTIGTPHGTRGATGSLFCTVAVLLNPALRAPPARPARLSSQLMTGVTLVPCSS